MLLHHAQSDLCFDEINVAELSLRELDVRFSRQTFQSQQQQQDKEKVSAVEEQQASAIFNCA